MATKDETPLETAERLVNQVGGHPYSEDDSLTLLLAIGYAMVAQVKETQEQTFDLTNALAEMAEKLTQLENALMLLVTTGKG